MDSRSSSSASAALAVAAMRDAERSRVSFISVQPPEGEDAPHKSCNAPPHPVPTVAGSERPVAVRLTRNGRGGDREAAVIRYVNQAFAALPYSSAKSLKRLARPKGFEPPTPRFVVWCSIQ